jgi:hypothetical protein
LSALSTLPPRPMSSSSVPGPGLARALPSVFAGGVPADSLTPAQCKAEAIRLLPKTGLSMRDCWRTYEGGAWSWSTIQRYFDAGYPKVCPKPRFVQWLKLRADIYATTINAREFEAAR